MGMTIGKTITCGKAAGSATKQKSKVAKGQLVTINLPFQRGTKYI